MNDLLDAALRYATRGWKVIPLHGVDEKGLCICRDGCTGKVVGKRPHIKEWQQKASTDEKTIREWWNKWPQANVAIVTGLTLIVIDIDPRNGGLTTLDEIEKKNEKFTTLCVQTGGGGKHFYYTKDAAQHIKGGTGLLGLGVDIKSSGGFVVAPPSRHASGFRYEWLNPTTPMQEIPPWILCELGKAQAQTAYELPEKIPQGERHNTLLSYAGRLRQAGLLQNEIEERLHKANERCVPPFSLQEINELVKSVLGYRVLDYTFDGFGNAHRFRDDHRNSVRRCVDAGCWYLWDTTRWRQACEDEIRDKCIETIERIRALAPLSGSFEEKLLTWAKCCRSERRVRELLYLSASLQELQIHVAAFDQPTDLINCLNGTLNLRTGALGHHHRNLYLTKSTGLRYTGGAQSTLWRRFLHEACCGRDDLINYLQLAAGYSLTGLTDEEKIFFVVGAGGTGKTTYVESVRGVLGDYSTTSNPQEFLFSYKSSGGPTPGIAKLAGVRLVVSSEIPHNARLSEWLIKSLTGGDIITARHLYQEEITFQPQFKLWMTMNELPKFNYRDTGIKRRIIAIPFDYKPSNPDPQLKKTLRTEAQHQEAILAWAVQGAMRWFANEKLSEPSCIAQTTALYQQQQNPLVLWLEDITERDEKGWIPSQRIKESLNLWAASHNMKLTDYGLTNDHALAESLVSCGFKKGVKLDPSSGKNANGWYGIRFKTENEAF